MTKKFRMPESARPGKKSGGRRAQVASALRQEISTMLSDGAIKDPRLSSQTRMITVTDVETTPDLKLARVYFSVFPTDETALKEVLKGMRSAAKQMKREVSNRLDLRYTPDLEFFLDKSIAEGAKIETLLREIRDTEDLDEDPDEDLDEDRATADNHSEDRDEDRDSKEPNEG
jgi:ribosome-binding factor A